MIAPRRRGLGVLLAGLLLAGCATEEDIAATRDALDQLETDLLEEHPELDDVTATYDVSAGVDRVSAISVRGSAALDRDEEYRDLAERIIERTWTSSIPEISELIVRLREADTQEFHGTRDVFGDQVVDDRELEARFGPRAQG